MIESASIPLERADAGVGIQQNTMPVLSPSSGVSLVLPAPAVRNRLEPRRTTRRSLRARHEPARGSRRSFATHEDRVPRKRSSLSDDLSGPYPSAREWYDRQTTRLGDRFGEELATVMATLAERPLMYQRLHREIRRAMTRTFPYAVYFIVDWDRVNVLRVLDQSRNPDEWRR